MALVGNWRAVRNEHEGLLRGPVLAQGKIEGASVAVEILVLE